MTKIQKLLHFLKDNPKATNEEIRLGTDLDDGTIKTYIHRLKEQGRIIVDGISGEGREVTVLETLNERKPAFKRDVYENMAETLLDDFQNAATYLERIEIGRLLFKVLDKF